MSGTSESAARVLLRGLGAAPGRAGGPVTPLGSLAEPAKFGDGAVLVTRITAFDYSVRDADWLDQHRDQFDFYSNGVRRRREPPQQPPAAEAGSPLAAKMVADVMHPGVITCLPQASLRDVARIMSSLRVHAVVVWGDEEDDSEGIWGLISDLDLVAAAAHGALRAQSAIGVAGTPVVTVHDTDTLEHAAELMRKNGVSHLVVLADGVEHPAGILSTLDVARAISELG